MDYWEFLTFDDAWENVLFPWFKKLSQANPSKLPNSVIAPNASVVSFLKERLLETKMSYVDLHFYTPSLLRKKLASLSSIHTKTLLREDFHLLLQHISSHFPTNPLAKSCSSEPEPLGRLIDSIFTARIEFASIPLKEAIPLIESLLGHTLSKNILPSQLLDRQILEHISSHKNIFFENALFFGFNAQSWAHFSLLKSAFLTAVSPVLCFPMSHPDTLIERAWQGTWESLSSPAELLPSNHQSPYTEFADSFENASALEQNSCEAPSLSIATSKLEEANLIFSQIVRWLNACPSARIGIIFPEQNSALAQMLSSILSDFNFPHHNTVYQPSIPSKEERAFRSLINFLSNPVLDTFLEFLYSLYALELINLTDLLQIKKDCHQAFLEIATDALPLIAHHIKLTHHPHPLNKILDVFPLLESEATFSEYFQKIILLLEKINYPADRASLIVQSSIPQQILEKSIPKQWFLTWLSGVAVMQSDTTHALGNHPYSKLHLLTPTEAAQQSWTHIILAELENTRWTLKNKDIPYLSYKDIRLLNSSIFEQGSFGTEHLVVKTNYTPFVLSSELSILAENNFARLLHLATEGLACTSTYDTLSSIPTLSPLLEKMIFLSKSLPANKEISVSECLYSSLLAKNFAQSTTKQCEDAYLNRQDPTTPFNVYSFSFESSLSKHAINASCKNWELILTKPEAAWMKLMVKAERQIDYATEDVLRIVMGSWVHDWICLDESQNRNFTPKPPESTWLRLANTKAHAELASLKELYRNAQLEVPSRFLSKWHRVLQITHNWIKTISHHPAIDCVACEYTLPENTYACIENICKIPVTGRLDLIAKCGDSNDASLWVIDFKTGNISPLTVHNFLKGKGLQLILYALALKSGENSAVHFSYLQPFSSLKQQCSLEDLSELTPLWKALQSIYERGVFGQKEFARFNHASTGSDYPMATLTILNSTLSKKWNLTHPNLVIKDR